MPDLSIIIPARNEMFLSKTIDNILENIEGNTEVIAVLDGAWADPPIRDDKRVTVIYHSKSIGQRASTNEAARLSKAKYIMKCDAHVAFDKGFDVKMMQEMHDDWTMVPRQYNLHAFDWVCKCGHRIYQGPTPLKCEKCGDKMQREIIWKPRWNRRSDHMRFDNALHFQYWGAYGNRPEQQGELAETMSILGACWMLTREKYWELNICDEGHGSWGQQGTEVSCKTWLSGGRLVVNKKTWFAHMFRTQGGDFGFPYPQSGRQIENARKYSKDLWLGNNWDKAIHPLSWMIEKFWPIPGWEEEDLKKLKESEASKNIQSVAKTVTKKELTKGIVYFTDNQLNLKIAHMVQKNLKKMNLPIVSASLKPMDFGKNVYLPLKRGYLTMFKQILAALEASDADIIFFCEHDVLYHPSHFEFTPSRNDVFYYNENVWKVDNNTGHALHYDCKQTSGLCAYRDLLIKHYKERVKRVEQEGYTMRMGFEPGTHNRPERVDDYKAEGWKSQCPNVDIRHDGNLTPSRWKQDQFRNKKYCQGWIESDEIPCWGKWKS